ncbi:MAG TPA: hypothetical protein VHW23_00140, partial [Kofleriaceae bacterium]|nr:hypothetical protein [Kofleriaceae bacterium]
MARCAVPALIARVEAGIEARIAATIEAMLAERGFPAARVAVSDLGLDHLQLTHVALGDGLALGTVDLDAGISLLWRQRIHQITIRGAELSAAALDRLTAASSGGSGRSGGPAGELPFDVVRIASAALTVAGARIAVSGTIAPAGGAVDLTASSDAVPLGPAVARDVRATLHDDADALRACAAGHVGAAEVEVCAALPRSLAALRTLRAVDTSWTATADGWRLDGGGTLAWASGVELRAGHAELTAPVLHGGDAAGDAIVHGAAIHAELTGRLAALELDVRGTAQADQLQLRERGALTTARGVRAPFAGRLALVDGALRATPRRPVIATARTASVRTADAEVELTGPRLAAFDAGRPIVLAPRLDAVLAPPPALRWSAAAARIGGAELRAPSGTLARHTLRWRAAEARWAGMQVRDPAGTVELGATTRHTATWTAITGPGPIELGAGELRAHRSPAGWAIDDGRATALGGELVAEPAAAAPDR